MPCRRSHKYGVPKNKMAEARRPRWRGSIFCQSQIGGGRSMSSASYLIQQSKGRIDLEVKEFMTYFSMEGQVLRLIGLEGEHST